MYKNISYFKGLNALRFFAASLVVLHHTATIGKKDGLFDLCDWGLFRNGANAVNFFFVLSGFLITYLLLKEHEQSGTISIKQFYLRRVRRIWPLYFLLIIIGTLLLPLAFGLVGIDYQMPYTLSQTWYYFLFFFPILVLFHYGHHFLEPLWSIGVEEVFYLLWAPLFKYFRRHIVAILSAIIVLKLASLMLIQHFCAENNVFAFLMRNYSFETMAVGALGACFLFNAKDKVETLWLFRKPFRVIICLLVPIFLCFNINIDNPLWKLLFLTPVFSPFLLSLLYLYLILAITICRADRTENRFLKFGGEISYGIYMYHMGIVFLMTLLLKPLKATLPEPLFVLLFILSTFLLTIVVAYISKRWFEDFFLKLGKKQPKH